MESEDYRYGLSFKDLQTHIHWLKRRVGGRAPGREGGVDKRGAAKSPAEKSPTPRSQRAVAEEFASAASDEEDEDMDGSTTTAPPNPRSRQKKKSRSNAADERTRVLESPPSVQLPPGVVLSGAADKPACHAAARQLYDYFVALRPELATEIAAEITELGRTVLNREEAQRKIGELVFEKRSRREDSEFA